MKKTTIEISVIMGVYNPKNKEQLMAAVASIVNQMMVLNQLTYL